MRLRVIRQIFQIQCMIEKPLPDLLTLSTTFYDLSVSRNLFSKAVMRRIGSSGTEWLKCVWRVNFQSQKDVDYVFKGDDDMLVIPDNLAYHIRKMAPGTSAFGNIKADDPVMREIETKYYMPPEIYPDKYYKTYFSGAAYVMRGAFATQLANVRR